MVYAKKKGNTGEGMKDPVCGMDVDEGHDHVDYKGKKFYFCCASCRWAFENSPDQFAK